MLKLANTEFYYLKLDESYYIFTSYDEAVSEVKDNIDVGEISEDDVELDKVEIDKDGEWKIKEISWFNFALELMK